MKRLIVTRSGRNRQEECVQMPVKIARSAPRPSFGLPELLVAIQPRVSLAARPEKREYLRQFGSHPGNPGLHDIKTRSG
jgi:hypothetical protein